MTARTNLSVVASVLTLTACGPDPADIALLERDAASSAAVLGAPLASANEALVRQGYKCATQSGEFTDETRKRFSAPSFLACAKSTTPVDGCSIRTQVVVVPEGRSVARVHFLAGDAFL